LFISANQYWADFVAGNQSPTPLFSNRLVLVSQVEIKLISLGQLPDVLGDRRLAIADPAHVPAGLYAKEALVHAGIWDSVAEKLAPADNVRAAVRLAQTGVAPFAIVYASDAKLLKLNVAYDIASDAHTSIIYWAVPLKKTQPEVVAFMQFLGSAQARAIVAMFGFLPLEGQ